MDIFKKWWFYVIAGLVILLLPFAIKTALEDPADTTPTFQDTAAPDSTATDTKAPDTTAPDTATRDTAPPDTAQADATAPDTDAVDTATPDTAPPDTAPPDTAPETRSTEITYILNTNTKKFHLPGCSSVKDMKDKNRQDTTLTRQEVIDLGYSPCGRCKP